MPSQALLKMFLNQVPTPSNGVLTFFHISPAHLPASLARLINQSMIPLTKSAIIPNNWPGNCKNQSIIAKIMSGTIEWPTRTSHSSTNQSITPLTNAHTVPITASTAPRNTFLMPSQIIMTESNALLKSPVNSATIRLIKPDTMPATIWTIPVII